MIHVYERQFLKKSSKLPPPKIKKNQKKTKKKQKPTDNHENPNLLIETYARPLIEY